MRLNGPIQTEAEHAAALAELERLWGAEDGTPEGDRLGPLMAVVDAYESERHAIEPADIPDAAIAPRLVYASEEGWVAIQRMLDEKHKLSAGVVARLRGRPGRAGPVRRPKVAKEAYNDIFAGLTRKTCEGVG